VTSDIPQLVIAADWPTLAACLQHVCMYFSLTSTLATDNASFTIFSITPSSTVHSSLSLLTVVISRAIMANYWRSTRFCTTLCFQEDFSITAKQGRMYYSNWCTLLHRRPRHTSCSFKNWQHFAARNDVMALAAVL